jgi:hypothetical protein
MQLNNAIKCGSKNMCLHVRYVLVRVPSRTSTPSDPTTTRRGRPLLRCSAHISEETCAVPWDTFFYSVAPTWDRGQNLQRLGASYLASHQLMAAWLETAISRVTDWTSTSSAPYLCALSLQNIKFSFLCNCQLLTIHSYWPLGHVLELTISICKQNQ